MKVRQQLDELRAEGYRVRVRHLRVWIPKTPRPGKKSAYFHWRRPGEAVNFKPVLASHDDRPLTFSIPAVLSRYGGRTEVDILHADDPTPIVTGVAQCKDSDVFVQRVGLNKALGRAIQELHALQTSVQGVVFREIH